ncbi:MAG: sugar ABC transporter substrate-binding protein [Burkholderiales bacterium]|nr:sugar ABC transporter substrate-binding protein [Burkholderiales bacterium]
MTAIAAAIAAPLLAGALPAQAANERLAAFYKNQVDPHFALVRGGVEAMAKQMGAGPVTNYAPTRPNNLAEQLSQIEDVTVKRPDAILFMAVDPRGVVPAIEKVNAAGIPIVNYNDRVAGGKFVSYVGADDFKLGLDTGRYALKAIGGEGGVVIIEGVKGSTTSDQRVAGFRKALEEFPKVKLLASQPANFQRLPALQVMENLIQGHPRIDAVLAAADAMALGAIEALEAAGRKNTKVVGINGVPEAIQAIKAGRLLATGEFDGFKIGCVATEAALRYLRKEPVPSEIILQGIVIDRSNLGPWDVPMEKRTCPKWADVAR